MLLHAFFPLLLPLYSEHGGRFQFLLVYMWYAILTCVKCENIDRAP